MLGCEMPLANPAVHVCDCRMQAERRHVFTTPKTFLELIKLYKSLLKKKREEASGRAVGCMESRGCWG